jgi:adenylate cyclase, class 2
MRNLELKARYADLAAAAHIAEKLGAHLQWTKTQIDTYFSVPQGRLKLRQMEGESSQLIAYVRPQIADAKLSDYRIFYTDAADDLLTVLSRALKPDVRIVKKRTLYLWKKVRIHLDCVDGLGDFIEFEAVLDSDYHEPEAQDDIDFLKNLFKIAADDLCESGYYELAKIK